MKHLYHLLFHGTHGIPPSWLGGVIEAPNIAELNTLKGIRGISEPKKKLRKVLGYVCGSYISRFFMQTNFSSPCTLVRFPYATCLPVPAQPYTGRQLQSWCAAICVAGIVFTRNLHELLFSVNSQIPSANTVMPMLFFCKLQTEKWNFSRPVFLNSEKKKILVPIFLFPFLREKKLKGEYMKAVQITLQRKRRKTRHIYHNTPHIIELMVFNNKLLGELCLHYYNLHNKDLNILTLMASQNKTFLAFIYLPKIFFP